MRIPSKKATTVFKRARNDEVFLGVLILFMGSPCSLFSESGLQQASLPPRGWNSYDSFCWTISEEEFLQSAEIVSQRLKAHGYQFVVVDYLWYRKKVTGAYPDSLGFDVIDEWGRMLPDPGRWPSSIGGKGFSDVANRVHSLGLKFGIHVMRGISTQAVNANTPILDTTKGGAYQESGRVWRAKDIAMPERACAWMPHGFMSVNTKLGAGRAFLKSLYEQYAAWGVDLGTSKTNVLSELNRPIVYSLSPGTSVTPAMAKDVSGLVNMYRITGDDWDLWEDVKAHFDVTRDFSTANMIGGKGLKGNSWPDLDMLPFGWLTDPGSNEGPHRFSKLTLEEKRTQMTLWSLAKSPLIDGVSMYPADYRGKHQLVATDRMKFCLDASPKRKVTSREFRRGTFSPCRWDSNQIWELNSNGTMVNSYSGLCATVEYVEANVNSGGIRSWIATGRTGEIYLAFFNLSEQKTEIYAKTSYLAKVLPDKSITSCKGKEVWSGTDVITTQGTISMNVEIHGCALFLLNCN
ncbi:hypothetical protein JHK82_013238 [Glycine max]|nr:hypothetical protein JHK86_013265 [Glycine max]KAG5155269.1 hypothetical protein JHK82_013238 [Glycine max]